jgi:hypothetical protein
VFTGGNRENSRLAVVRQRIVNPGRPAKLA